MHIINTNNHSVSPKLRSADGKEDYMHLAAKGKARIPEGFTVDANWMHSNGDGVKLRDEETPLAAAVKAAKAAPSFVATSTQASSAATSE